MILVGLNKRKSILKEDNVFNENVQRSAYADIECGKDSNMLSEHTETNSRHNEITNDLVLKTLTGNNAPK
jgi:hypothetical protein